MARWIIRYNIILSMLLLLAAVTLNSNNSIVLSQSGAFLRPVSYRTNGWWIRNGRKSYFSRYRMVGVFALGIITRLLAFNIKISNNVTAFVKKKKNNFINSSIIHISWCNPSFISSGTRKGIVFVGNILFDFRYFSNSLWYNYCICKKSKN